MGKYQKIREVQDLLGLLEEGNLGKGEVAAGLLLDYGKDLRYQAAELNDWATKFAAAGEALVDAMDSDEADLFWDEIDTRKLKKIENMTDKYLKLLSQTVNIYSYLPSELIERSRKFFKNYRIHRLK